MKTKAKDKNIEVEVSYEDKREVTLNGFTTWFFMKAGFWFSSGVFVFIVFVMQIFKLLDFIFKR